MVKEIHPLTHQINQQLSKKILHQDRVVRLLHEQIEEHRDVLKIIITLHKDIISSIGKQISKEEQTIEDIVDQINIKDSHLQKKLKEVANG